MHTLMMDQNGLIKSKQVEG